MVITAPELDIAVTALASEGASFVVIGGFAVAANGFTGRVDDIDFLIPDDVDNDLRVLTALRQLDGLLFRDNAPLEDQHLLGQAHLRVVTAAGLIDVLRDGPLPLDFDTVKRKAIAAEYDDVRFLVAGLASVVGFKRLAGRVRDEHELAGLAEVHGELPIEPIPGLDT